jgi:hypothetical protein
MGSVAMTGESSTFVRVANCPFPPTVGNGSVIKKFTVGDTVSASIATTGATTTSNTGAYAPELSLDWCGYTT